MFEILTVLFAIVVVTNVLSYYCYDNTFVWVVVKMISTVIALFNSLFILSIILEMRAVIADIKNESDVFVKRRSIRDLVFVIVLLGAIETGALITLLS